MLQTRGCNSAVVMQVVMDVIKDYSALSFGVSVETLTQLVSVSSHFTCNLLTTITCTYSLSGINMIYHCCCQMQHYSKFYFSSFLCHPHCTFQTVICSLQFSEKDNA